MSLFNTTETPCDRLTSPAPTPGRPEPITNLAIAEAFANAEGITSLLVALRDRLSNVLRNEPSSCKDECKDGPPSNIPIVVAINKVAAEQRKSAAIIRDILDRLEV